MLRIMCLVNPEDYASLNSMMESNLPINYYGYTFTVDGGSETSGGNSVVKFIVVELINAQLSVGFVVPENKTLEGEFQLNFISQDNINKEIPIVCKLSNEVKHAQYMGDDTEKAEYLGFSLEQFYQSKGATFYLYDLRELMNKPS